MGKALNLHPSDSAVQRKLEQSMLKYIQDSHPEWRRIDWDIAAKELALPEVWHKAQPDAVWMLTDKQFIIAECYTRITPMKPGQHRKLAMDVLKLLSLRKASPKAGRIRCLLVVTEETNNQLKMGGWLNAAIRQSADIITVTLSKSDKTMLRKAVTRQAAGQTRTKKVSKKK